MKIKLLKGLVVNKTAHQKGDEVEVSDRDGLALIANSNAVKVLELPKQEVPKPKRTRTKVKED